MGHPDTQPGSFPAAAMSGQKSHFSTVPIRRGWPRSGEYGSASARIDAGGLPQLKNREEYGQAAMQNLHPMQRSLSTSTTPSRRLKVAPTGHTLVHGGLSQ